MRIDVIGKHLEVTPAILAYAQNKAERLTKYFDGTQQIKVLLEAPSGKAGQFHVEVVVDVVKHDDFVANAIEDDLYAAIDGAVDKAQRQLRDYKDRLKN